jgi:hypothetical protein
MTDDEQSLMGLGVQLRDGIQDMLDGGRLRLEDIPDDDQWLVRMLRDIGELSQRVREDDDQ